MGFEDKDLQDVKLARPVAIIDLWDIDDRIGRLEEITERLERAVKTLVTLYYEERVKSWELILKEMMNQRDRKYGHKTS